MNNKCWNRSPFCNVNIKFNGGYNYSGTQKNSTCEAGSAQNRKMRVQLERLHLKECFLTNHLLNVSLKRKTDNISIILRRMTTEKRARIVRWYATTRCWYTPSKSFFPENVYKSHTPADKCRSFRQTKLSSSFSSRKAFDACIQRSGA